MGKGDNEREYRCKIRELKILCLNSTSEETFFCEVPWPDARARVPREDAVRTKGLGTKANPRNHTILGISREKTKVLP